MKDPFIKRLTLLAERDPRVMLLVGDLGFGMVEPFIAKCPKQFLNVGVAEQNMAGIATGLALEGNIVFAYSIANFATLRCLEQIRNDASYHGANVNFVAMGGGFSYGALGISHHATEDLAILRCLPGLTVMSPGDDWEASEATEALAYRAGTGYLRLDKSSASTAIPKNETFELGKARRLREGSDLTLVATGGIVGEALAAADKLAESGLQCRVLSFHTVQPLDTAALQAAAAETGGIVTLEEHTVLGGLGGAVAETLLETGPVPKVFHRMGLRAGFSSVVGSQTYLRGQYGLDARTIVATVSDLVRGKGKHS